MVTKEAFDKLRELQDILARKNQLEIEIKEAPEKLGKLKELLARYKENYIKKNTDYESMRQNINALKADLFAVEQRLEQAEKSMDSVTTQREYDALDKEIQEATKKENELRKEILKNETTYKRLDEEIKEDENSILQQEKELNDRNEVINQEIAAKQSELASLNAAEEKLSPDLDSDTLFKFDRIIRNKHGVGIVPVQGNVCMGCHMILSAQFAIEVREGKNIMYCPYCSRILYYEESDTDSVQEMLFDDSDMGSLADLDSLDDASDEAAESDSLAD
ncbi:MAG: zinc ribbon domain-containing protein [Treponema sp.]